jgi:hypothetical protein
MSTANRLIVCIALAAGCSSAGSMDDPNADNADHATGQGPPSMITNITDFDGTFSKLRVIGDRLYGVGTDSEGGKLLIRAVRKDGSQASPDDTLWSSGTSGKVLDHADVSSDGLSYIVTDSSGGQWVYQSDLDGKNERALYTEAASTDAWHGVLLRIAASADDHKVYFTRCDGSRQVCAVLVAPSAGGSQARELFHEDGPIDELTVGNSYLAYSFAGQEVRLRKTSGDFVSGRPRGVNVSQLRIGSDRLFWIESRQLLAQPLNSSSNPSVFFAADAFAVANDALYLALGGSLNRSKLDGSQEELIAKDNIGIADIVVDAGQIYWSSSVFMGDFVSGHISRLPVPAAP